MRKTILLSLLLGFATTSAADVYIKALFKQSSASHSCKLNKSIQNIVDTHKYIINVSCRNNQRRLTANLVRLDYNLRPYLENRNGVLHATTGKIDNILYYNDDEDEGNYCPALPAEGLQEECESSGDYEDPIEYEN